MPARIRREQLHLAGLRDLPAASAGVLRGREPVRRVGRYQDQRGLQTEAD